ncbi:MAG: host attachment protein [Caldimonas sp.]
MAQPNDPRPQSDTNTARSDAAAGPDSRSDDGKWANRGVTPRGGQGIGWVVVADEAIARILTTTDAPGTLDPVEALTDPAAHAKEGDLHVNDAGRRGGRVSNDGGQGGARGGAGGASLTASAGTENRHLEARAFARRVAQHLATALQQKRYATLRIIAAPRFLGYLRQELDAAVRAVVTDELAKDLIHASDDEIAKRTFEAPPGA